MPATQPAYIDVAPDVAHIVGDAGLPADMAQAILRSLSFFMERDADPLPPDFSSLRLFLAFLSAHRELTPPLLGISEAGVLQAVWQTQGEYRWTLEFMPAGNVRWIYLEKRDGRLDWQEGTGRSTEIIVPGGVHQTIPPVAE